jgi:arylsulfatase A-like enzyme
VNARSLRPASADAQQQRPNFIVIVTDDQGWDDIGMHNPDYVKTPNIDRLVVEQAMCATIRMH